MTARRVWHKRPLVNGGRWLSTTLRFESPLSSSFHSLLPLPPGSASPIRYPIIAYNVNGRWFSSEAMADVAAGGNGNGIVDVPLAQTGEGIAECELLKWFVREWVADINTWRSITGYVVFFGGNPISWQSKKRSSVSRSSTEAEYKFLTHCAADACWLRSISRDLHVYLPSPPVLH